MSDLLYVNFITIGGLGVKVSQDKILIHEAYHRTDGNIDLTFYMIDNETYKYQVTQKMYKQI